MFLRPTEVMRDFPTVWFFSSFISSVEEKFSVVFDSWTRSGCNFIFPSVFPTLAASRVGNILDGWLPKNVSCQTPVRILEVREKLSSCDFYILILKFELWFFSKVYLFFFSEPNPGKKRQLSSFCVRLTWRVSSVSVVPLYWWFLPIDSRMGFFLVV